MMSNSALQSGIVEAATSGDLAHLSKLLAGRSKKDVSAFANATIDNTTPLVNACLNGCLEVTIFLLDQCNVDIEKVGNVTINGENVEGAPPLWCAAVRGDVATVEALVKRGASVNNGTISCSTPLRASSHGGFIDIVKFLVKNGGDIEISTRYGTSCLMISCYKGHIDVVKYLLKLGAQVNRRTIRDESALEFAAEANNMEIIKLLLKYGANVNSLNCRSFTALTYVIERNDINSVKFLLKHKAKFEIGEKGMSPLMTAAAERQETIVEYLISRPECTRLGAIEALELIGASLLCRTNNTEKAGTYWRRAMIMRLNNSILKTNVNNPHSKMLQLEELENLLLDDTKAYTEALEIFEQVLGPIHPATVNGLRYRGAALADTGHFQEAYELWIHALTNLLTYDRLFYSYTSDMLLWFVRVFNEIRDERKFSEFPTFSQVSLVIHCSVSEIKRCVKFPGPANKYQMAVFNGIPNIILHLISIAISLVDVNFGPESDEMAYLTKLVYELVQLVPRADNARSLLHIAVDQSSSKIGRHQVRKFPDRSIISLLLFCGIDVNATDNNRNIPLHVIAADDQTKTPVRYDIISLLLQHGAHYDARNDRGKTARELAAEKNLRWDWCSVRLTSLQCLAATVIVQTSIPYRGIVSSELEKFISLH